MANKVFSDFEVEELGIKFNGKTKFETMGCVGSAEESLEVKTVSKKCRGVVAKTRTKGTGTGEVKLSLHMPYDIFTTAYGLEATGLKEGVRAYGQLSIHKEFCMVQKVSDEDGNVKYKAYPKCMIKDGISRKVENGAEEVAELEVTISIMPDELGYGMYEALESDITDGKIKTDWMTAFTPDLVKASAAPPEA